ncbi:MAG: hypothetical protein DRG78_02320 [Epsilonproteobacteria bacterium]|nr:MAG: hypothetical protein DRG78_02320 [Campylobacterota bacterium]
MQERNKNLIEVDIDISKGMLMGEGINLRKETQSIENVFIPWNNLNSHMMCFGTTRMGKTRLMTFMIRQIIEKNDHVFIVDPKGSEDQEVFSWISQYANEFNSLKDIVYWSPERPRDSIKFNLLYGQSDEEIISTIISVMDVKDEFYKDIANEILTCVLAALSFLSEIRNPYVNKIMMLIEKQKIQHETISYINDAFDFNYIKEADTILNDMISKLGKNDDEINQIKQAYTQVKRIYKNPDGEIPVRQYITFQDLAKYSSFNNIHNLYEVLQNTSKKAIKDDLTSNIIENGKQAEASLKRLCETDAGYFSKVSTSYAVTMSRLSTGNVGRLLCESKINVLKDRFYNKDKRIIFFAQPYPMKYTKAADMLIKMLMAMLNNIIANVGVTGNPNHKRTHVMIDEAGSITNEMMLSLINKGGGLGLSLYLFSQSFADYKNTLGEEGATIMADNANSKAFFLVNDNKSAQTISDLIGGKKKADISYGTNEGTTSRLQAKTVDEALIPPHLVTQLDPMTYILKTGKDVYVMISPYQRDSSIEIIFDNTKEVKNG